MARERLVSGEDRNEDKEFNWGLRPRSLDEYIGQRESVERLQISIEATKMRGEVLDHVLLHGPPGLGKCITKDSLILTDEGLVAFEELIPQGMQPGETRPTRTRVYGLGGLESASHIYCSGVTPTRRITTRSGFVLEGTLHHPVLVASAEGVQWKPLGNLAPSDHVAVSRGANLWGKEQSAIYRPATAQQRRMRSEPLVRQLHEEFSQALQRPPSVVELREAYCVVRGIADTPTPSRTVHRLGLAVSDGRVLREKQRPSLPASIATCEAGRMVHLDAELGYLLGVVVGDGHVEKGAASPSFVITCAEEAMQHELQRVSRYVYGTAPEVKQYGDKAARLRFSSQQGRVLQAFGLKPVNAREKSVPSAILKGPRATVIGFLQGLFDADGHSRIDGVELYTRSERLSRETQLLLANFGIIAYRRSRMVNDEPFWSLFIGGSDAIAFHQHVGFRLEHKRQAFTPTPAEHAGWSRSDLVPGANPLLCALLRKSSPQPRATHRAFEHAKNDDRTPTRHQIARLLELLPDVSREPEYALLQTLCDERFCWDRVIDQEPSEAETYDFVVPGTHSFVANGIVNHNTTLSYIIAEEMGREIALTSGPALERPADVMGFLVNAKEGDIIFIDEIHRLPRIVEEFLYSAMEDWIVNFTLDKGMYSKPLPIRLEKFTIIGATTRPAMLTRPLRDRFGIQQHLDFYDETDLVTIARRSAHLLHSPMDEEGAHEIARRSRGTPRITNRLLRRVRDFALVRADGIVTSDVAKDALRLEGIDNMGLDRLDHAVMRVIKDTYGGGPVGIEALAATLNEESDTLVDVVEPYLLKIGFLARTPAGRRITRRAYEHLGEVAPASAIGPIPSLFDEAIDAEPRLHEKTRGKLPFDGKVDDKDTDVGPLS